MKEIFGGNMKAVDDPLVSRIETRNEKLKNKIKSKIKELKEELAYQEDLLNVICENEGFDKLRENLGKYPYWVSDGRSYKIECIDWTNDKITVCDYEDAQDRKECTFLEFVKWFEPYEAVTY
jgi:hypothetical protein